MAYSVTQNASFLTGASILQKIISFVYFTLVARFLGVEQTGAYFFAITFTTIFSVLADVGFGPVLTREIARTPGREQELVPTVLSTKVVLSILTYGFVVLMAHVLNYSVQIQHLVYVSGITMVFDNLQTVFFSILRAHKNLFYEALGVIVAQGLTLLIGTIALFNGWPLFWLVLAYTIPSGCNLILAALVVKRKFSLAFFTGVSRPVLKMLFLLAWPFALASFIGRLYSYTDTVLISKLLSPHDLGWWGLGNKIVTAFQFIPIALTASIYPAMSSWFMTDRSKVVELFEKSWRYLFIVLFPVVFGIGVLAHPIITLIYGADFLPAAPVLQILLASVWFGFLSLVTGATLNATGNQVTQTILLAISLGCNIILNIILIPRFGIIGAAGVEVVTNGLLCVTGLLMVRRKVSIRVMVLLTYLGQVLLPAGIMAVVVAVLSRYIYFLFTIPIGGAVYVALLFVTGALTPQFIKQLVAKFL